MSHLDRFFQAAIAADLKGAGKRSVRRPAPPPPKALKNFFEDIRVAQEIVFTEVLLIQQQRDDEAELKRLQELFVSEEVLFKDLFKQPTFDCGICLEALPLQEAARVDDCNHKLCKGCMKGYVTSKIQERRYPISCPLCQVSEDGKEGGMVGVLTVQALGIAEEDLALFEELQMTQFAVLVECRSCNRTSYIDREEHQESKILNCPLPGCCFKWCKSCQQAIDPQSTVEHSCDGTNELDALIQGQNWKRCPQCTTPVERISGCNHLVCIAPACNTQFCYKCGETIYRGVWSNAASEAKFAHLNGPCGFGY